MWETQKWIPAFNLPLTPGGSPTVPNDRWCQGPVPLFIYWAPAGELLCLFLEASGLSSGLFWGTAVLRVAWAHLSVYEGTDVFLFIP